MIVLPTAKRFSAIGHYGIRSAPDAGRFVQYAMVNMWTISARIIDCVRATCRADHAGGCPRAVLSRPGATEYFANRGFAQNSMLEQILGAASGIGKACAEVLAALGATVICADKNIMADPVPTIPVPACRLDCSGS